MNIMLILLIIIAIAFALLYGIINLTTIPGIYKFLLVFIEMILVSQILIRRYKFSSELGMVLIKSKEGIKIIENIADRYGKAFDFLADVGVTMSYGLLSRVLMKKNTSIQTILIGLAVLFFMAWIVGPTASAFLIQIIKMGTIDKSTMGVSDNPWAYIGVISLILLIGGLFLFVVAGIIFYGGVIFAAFASSVFYGTNAISHTAPGGTFILPGVNLPFFEGIIALMIVLIVHEGTHAVLTRRAKVPLLSSGIVLFGVIPVGAFVEPDEKKLERVEQSKQTRVLVGGATANLFTSAIAFLLFLGIALAFNMLDGGTAVPLPAPVKFVMMSLGLTFALNFIVGTVNLLPLPLFDGFRLMDVNLKNKNIVKALMYITLFFFALNFLPWLFRA
jgi:hypothetical protein